MILKPEDVAYLIEMSVRVTLDQLPPRRDDLSDEFIARAAEAVRTGSPVPPVSENVGDGFLPLVGANNPLWCPECDEQIDPLAPDSHIVMQRPNGESLLLIACEGFHLFEVTQ